MIASSAIKQFIKNEEGLRLQVYVDSNGDKTIGYGHKLTKGSALANILLGTAEELFNEDLSSVESFLNRIIKPPITQSEYDALCSLVFNMGESQFQASSIFTYWNRGQLINMTQEMMKYCHDSKRVVLSGLFKRRLKESMIFLGIKVNYP